MFKWIDKWNKGRYEFRNKVSGERFKGIRYMSESLKKKKKILGVGWGWEGVILRNRNKIY